MSLLDQIVSHYKLDEAVDTVRADDVGFAALADINHVASATGLLGNAAVFDDTTKRLASAPVMLDTTAGLTVHGWIKPNADGMVFALDAVIGTNRILQVMYHPAFGGYLECIIFGSGTSVAWNVSGSDVPANVWSRIAVWWDPADGKGRIRINDNADVVSGGSIAVLNSGTVPIEIGDLGGFSQPYGGLADEFAIWNRVLMEDELDTLWNGGAPLPFSSYGPAPPAPTGSPAAIMLMG